MKFILDENLPVELADLLKENGYEDNTVLEQKWGGKPDEEIISHCQEELHALITLDMDFSDIRHYPPFKYSGIIVLKVSNQSKKNILLLSEKFIPLLRTEPLKGQLWIVEENRIRIREKENS